MSKMRSCVAALALLTAGAAFGQVLSPPEIRDLRLRELQQKHLPDLKRVAAEITAHSFPYRLYLSRTLDLNEDQQRRSDQRSIRFDTFHGQTVLEITANYYASYSADLMSQEERASRTLQDVVTPMLQAAVPAMAGEDQAQSLAIEISHHVRHKVLGVTHENPENVAFILPLVAARQMIAAVTPGEREAALMQGQLFVNRQPVEGWAKSDAPLAVETIPPVPVKAAVRRDVSADVLRNLQSTHQADLDRMVRELDAQAHFVPYAAPAFIGFRNGVYLQLSLSTVLTEAAAVSQYQVAALSFDQHIAHLIRPVLASLKGHADFDGIDFSTSVRVAGAPAGSGTAVEFIFTTDSLGSYRNFDMTGQELIKAGIVLINGERVGLELQSAEAGITRPVSP